MGSQRIYCIAEVINSHGDMVNKIMSSELAKTWGLNIIYKGTHDECLSLSDDEIIMIKKGKKHWDLDVLNEMKSGRVDSKTIKLLISNVIESTWTTAKSFYEKKQ